MAVLVALGVILHRVEALLPLPSPWVKLGLANISRTMNARTVISRNMMMWRPHQRCIDTLIRGTMIMGAMIMGAMLVSALM